MNRRTPIATALLALFAAPAAWSQQSDVSPEAGAPTVVATAGADVGSAGSAALPAVTVDGDASHDGFTKGASSLSKVGDLHDAPQSVIVLNKALLQSQGATSLADALHNVPGITLGGAEGGQIGNNINLNGFTARTDIYLDGFRDRGQYYRDTFALDSVEALMGPSSMLFGRGSTGGVINQVTKKPSMKASDEVSASVTSNGMVRATADHNQALSDFAAARISVMAQDGAPTTRDVMKNRDYGVAPALKFGFGTPTEVTIQALLQHNHDMPDYGVPPLNGAPVKVDRNTYYGFTDDHTIQDVGALSATVEHRISPTTTLRNMAAYNDVRVNAQETAPQTVGTISPVAQPGIALVPGFTALPVPTTATTITTPVSALPLDQLSVRLQSHDRVIHDKTWSDQADLNFRFDTGTVKHNLLVGGELDHDTYVNQAYYRNGSCNGVALNPSTGTSGYVACEPLLDPSYTSSPANAPSKAGNLANSVSNGVGVYVNDAVEINPQFKLVGGLRYDNFEAKVYNTITSATVLPQVDQTVHFTSVRAGGIWQPTDEQSYYLSYSTSFNPSLEQLTNTTGASVLPPEKNRAYELGGKWDPVGGKVSFTASAFDITQYNARAQQSDGTYLATGTVEVKGVRLGAAGELNKQWKVFSGMAYLDGRIIDGIAVMTQGNVPLNTPKLSGNVWTTYEFAPHWEVGGGATLMSDRFVNNTDLVRVPGYTRFDATLAYRQKAYDVRLNLFNLTDKYYYDALIQSDGGRSVPGTGRSAMLSVVYRM